MSETQKMQLSQEDLELSYSNLFEKKEEEVNDDQLLADVESTDDNGGDGTSAAKKRKRRRSSSGIKKRTKTASSQKDDDVYEVEKILDVRKRHGERQYLIKYKSCDDGRVMSTWKPEKQLSCKDLIKQFHETDPEECDFEAEKLLKVRYDKNGRREYIVKWKYYDLNEHSWEPEANLRCHDLIKAFKDAEEVAAQLTEVVEEETSDTSY